MPLFYLQGQVIIVVFFFSQFNVFYFIFFKKMPPKKKRCPPPPNKPGIGQQHLLDNFSQLPTDGDFLNGHILYLYSCRCGSSWTKTVQEILSLLPTDSSTPDSCRTASLHAAIKRIVSRTLKKFHRLTNETEFRTFADICKEEFSLKPRQVTPHLCLSLDDGHDELPKTPVKKLASKSPLKTRQLAKCKNCKQLNKRMIDMKRRQLELQRDRIIAIRNLRMKQKNKGAIKTLNQSIRRKNKQIEQYKTKATGYASAEKRLASLEKKHRELKKYHKMSKKTLVFEDCM